MSVYTTGAGMAQNILMQLLQNEEETMGYLISGMRIWNQREQDRFEEEALFLSAALNAVIGNRRLEEANNAILRLAEQRGAGPPGR